MTKFPKVIEFDKPILVINWQTDNVAATIPPEKGWQLIARSSRWDDQHATADVRTLHENDCIGPIAYLKNKPVTFAQL